MKKILNWIGHMCCAACHTTALNHINAQHASQRWNINTTLDIPAVCNSSSNSLHSETALGQIIFFGIFCFSWKKKLKKLKLLFVVTLKVRSIRSGQTKTSLRLTSFLLLLSLFDRITLHVPRIFGFSAIGITIQVQMSWQLWRPEYYYT